MDALELATELQSLLSSRKWAGDDANPPTFGAVIVAPVVRATSSWAEYTPPFCVIELGSANADPQMPDIVTQAVRLRVWQRMESSESGEALMLGRNKEDTASTGQGLLRFDRELAAVMTVLSQANGITINQRFTSAASVVLADEGVYGYRDYTYEAEISTFPDAS